MGLVANIFTDSAGVMTSSLPLRWDDINNVVRLVTCNWSLTKRDQQHTGSRWKGWGIRESSQKGQPCRS